MAKLTRWLITILLIPLVSSCLMKLAYNHADTLLSWELDNYFDLTTQQKHFVQQRFRHFIVWHRKHEIDKYIGFLMQTKDDISNGLTAKDVDWFFTSLNEFKISLGEELADDAAGFLSTVTPDQITYLKGELKEINEKLEQRVKLTPEERLEKRSDEIIGGLEKWTGPLWDSQKKRIAVFTGEIPDVTAKWLVYRRFRQHQFIEIIKTNNNSADLKDKIYRWFVTPMPLTFDEHQEKVKWMILQVYQLLTTQQRARFASEIQDLIDDLREIRNNN